ncbi:MAG: hypothetical protein EOO06_10395 [Chitinophagaceae bacterium]|nr:MAG: hypothetical protein EOO06_10395 [Chitinophagaceae bacterium]
MELGDSILVNRFGQGLTPIDPLVEKFASLDIFQKRKMLNDVLFLTLQSRPQEGDNEAAIIESRLKPTFTPCVLLRKGMAHHHLQKIIDLPESELNKAFLLFLNLFKIAYKRRFDLERGSLSKWWYWDLSDDTTVKNLFKKIIP